MKTWKFLTMKNSTISQRDPKIPVGKKGSGSLSEYEGSILSEFRSIQEYINIQEDGTKR